MIDVGLIGFGFAGRTFHAPMIHAVEGLRLAAIVQRHGSEALALYPSAKIVRTVEEMLAIPTIRLVVIATPNPTHFPLAKQCLLAGRDVVIDKPFATTYAEAKELIDLASEKSRLLSVYQNRRFDGDFLTLQRVLAESEIGRPVLLESRFDRFRPQLRPDAWREHAQPGSGVLFDLGPHLIDQALVLFGQPEAIAADVRIERDGAATDDAFDVMLYYPQVRALLRAGVLVSAPTPRFTLQGTQGSYVKFGLDPQEDALKLGEAPKDHTWGQEPEERWGILRSIEGGSLRESRIPTLPGDYRKYYENIRDVLLGKAELAVTPQQALDVMRALELAHESSRRRCAMPWIE
jgi:predicted dehydrogenase